MAAVGPNDGNEGRCSGPQTAEFGQNLARTLIADRDEARNKILCRSKAYTIAISPASNGSLANDGWLCAPRRTVLEPRDATLKIDGAVVRIDIHLIPHVVLVCRDECRL